MDRDAFEDHLVDKAKELLHENADMNHVKDRNREDVQHAEEAVTNADDVEQAKQNMKIQREEADFLAHRRSSMDNDELRSFLKQDSGFHDALRNADDLDSTNSERSLDRVKSPISSSFADWEQRVLLMNQDKSAADLAEELDRSVAAVKYQQQVLGLDQDL